ncbi:hypothetical protein GF318_05605 [Candidatus Micrarchaeota archaeon]|nr:hypothetical protein [Candidatus Micrarchaeota archaeon]
MNACNRHRAVRGLSRKQRKQALNRINSVLEKYHQLGTERRKLVSVAERLDAPINRLRAANVLLVYLGKQSGSEMTEISLEQGWDRKTTRTPFDEGPRTAEALVENCRISRHRLNRLKSLRKEIRELASEYQRQVEESTLKFTALGDAIENKRLDETGEPDCRRHLEVVPEAFNSLHVLISRYSTIVEKTASLCVKGLDQLLDTLLARVPDDKKEYVAPFLKGS